MIIRKKYLNQLIAFQDKDLVKVVTGVRRCGKSTLLEMMGNHLRAQGVSEERLVMLKMESMEFDAVKTYRELYDLIRGRVEGVQHPYIFLDELQEVTGWERAVNALRVDIDCDLYITGSNAHLLSSELSTLLSGRYVEVEMQPLVFSEYLDFRGVDCARRPSASGGVAQMSDGQFVTLDALLGQFLQFGGLPFLALSSPNVEEHRIYCKSLYDTVITRDILMRDRRHDRRRLNNPELLEKVCRFLANNIGNECSFNSMAAVLRAEGSSASNATVEAYVDALKEAYLFYRARRYDVRGKELLKTGGKHYIVDTGMRSYLEGYRNTDVGRVLENAVYLELRYRGYEVSVGKLRAGEIDFVATRPSERWYIQVCDDMRSHETQERELAPLRALRDSHPKTVIVRDGTYPTDIDGVRIVPAVDFFLGER